jgi:hypothetical protein
MLLPTVVTVPPPEGAGAAVPRSLAGNVRAPIPRIGIRMRVVGWLVGADVLCCAVRLCHTAARHE